MRQRFRTELFLPKTVNMIHKKHNFSEGATGDARDQQSGDNHMQYSPTYTNTERRA